MTPSALRIATSLTAVVLMTGLTVASAPHADAATATQSFTTAGCSTWTVPGGVNSLQISAFGAAGGTARAAGGKGDGVSATLSGVAGGQTFRICVDVKGGIGPVGAGAGGGASGVSRGSDFSTPLLVAGGGGGGGSLAGGNFAGAGGAAGLPSGQSGGYSGGYGGGGGGGNNVTATGGGGGFATTSGAPGAPGSGTTAAGPGSGGTGGARNGFGGGGGGAGYFGGGGGGAGQPGGGGAGGGGGSDLCTNSATLTGCAVTTGAGTQTTAGAGAGQARVAITYTAPQAPVITSASGANFTVGTPGSFDVTTTGTPTPSLSDGGATLPAGVTFKDNGDGTATLAGTPAPGTTGVYGFTFTASNGASPDATQAFTLRVQAATVVAPADTPSPTSAAAPSLPRAGTGGPPSGPVPGALLFAIGAAVLSWVLVAMRRPHPHA